MAAANGVQRKFGFVGEGSYNGSCIGEWHNLIVFAVMSEMLIRGHNQLRAIPIAGKKTQMHPSVIVLKGIYQKLSAKEFMKILFDKHTE
jgi:hypothetical protein